MPPRKPLDIGQELLDRFDHAMRVTEYLVSVIPTAAWHAEPPAGGGRTIAAIVAHMHSLRRTFANMGTGRSIGPSLDRQRVTRRQAVTALRQSRKALRELFAGAIARGEGRVGKLPRRVIDMMTYLIQHDAHHRGQITRQIRELGHALPKESTTIIWGWRKLS